MREHDPDLRKDETITMSRSAFRHLRLLGPLTVAATLGMGALPALAQTAPTTVASDCSAIHFELSNPAPGSMVAPGGYVLQGFASDSRAQQGTGVDKVDFFLDSREQGGLNLGTAIPGMVPGPFGADSFQTTLTLPTMTGGHDLFAYAHSSVSGAESVLSIPVALNEDPSKAFLNPASETTATETCMTGSTSGMTSTTATPPMEAPAPPITIAPTTTTTTTGDHDDYGPLATRVEHHVRCRQPVAW